MAIKPWAEGAFELLVHGELHLRGGSDFDRRIALISFDNCVEVAINTHLNLDPLQRAGLQYVRTDVDKWSKNFHTKLDFFFGTFTASSTLTFEKTDVVWTHDIRNDQYHGKSPTIPRIQDVTRAKEYATTIFSELFFIQNTADEIEEAIKLLEKAGFDSQQKPTSEYDDLIDEQYDNVIIADEIYKVSEILKNTDIDEYNRLGKTLQAEKAGTSS